MNNNARYDRSTNFLKLEVNVPRTIGILRDECRFLACTRTLLAVNSDYDSQRRELPAQLLAKGLHFPVVLKCKFIFIECEKSMLY